MGVDSVNGQTGAVNLSASDIPDAASATALASAEGSALVGFQQRGSDAIPYSQLDKSQQICNVLDYVPTNLHEAIYARTNTVDLSPYVQTAIDEVLASGGGELRFDYGTYLIVHVELPTVETYFNYRNPAIRIIGKGLATIITANQSLATDIVDYSNEVVFSKTPVIAIYGSNHSLENLAFENCINPIYLGQDGASAAKSSTCFNRIKTVWIRNCGTGVLLNAGDGAHYNSFEDMHIYQCQIAMHLRNGDDSVPPPNVNRNQFRKVRGARSRVGLWIEDGDTNELLGFDCEGNAGIPTNCRYALPDNLPAELVSRITANGSCGKVYDTNSNRTLDIQGTCELCDVDVWIVGPQNTVIGNYDDTAVYFGVAALRYITPTAFVYRNDIVNFSGGRTDFYADPGASSAVRFHKQIWTSDNWQQTQGGVRSISRVIDLGSFTPSSTTSKPLQDAASTDIYLRDTSGVIDCELIGDCETDNQAYYKRFKVLYRRNAARTITRLSLFDDMSWRATGINVGDSAEPFVTTVSVSGLQIQLHVTAPARTFGRVTLNVTERRLLANDLSPPVIGSTTANS